MFEVIIGNCFNVLDEMEEDSVDCVVTSPPYLALRRYGDSEEEFGQDATVEGYVDSTVELFKKLRRVMKPHGLAWLNIGDRANYSGGAGGDWKGKAGGPSKFHDKAFAKTSYLNVPGKVVDGLLDDQWRLRSEIIWAKPAPHPEAQDHVKRPLVQHEKIYMLTPTQGKYQYHPERIEEMGSIWQMKTGGSGLTHLAPFPDELPRRCILLSTEPGDTVLDPFSGAHSTARTADTLGRNGIGIELYA